MTLARRRRTIAALAAGALGAAVWRGVPAPGPVPRFEAVRGAYCPSESRLLDRNGVVLHESRLDHARRRLAWATLASVSPALIAAVLASEDRRFETHGGVDAQAAAAAAWQYLRGGGAGRGASTISMQVAALLDPTLAARHQRRSLRAKWRQMRSAWAIEKDWSKAQILEAYLNLVTFRGELQGVAAAAHVLFGKAAHGLNHAEAAVLGALVRAPNTDTGTLGRRAARLQRSVSAGGAADPEALAAALRRVSAAAGGPRNALAPHAAHRLLPAAERCTDMKSTLDAATQRVAVDAVRRHLFALRDRSVRDAAVLVADNHSGDILAYVGSSADLSPAPHVDGVQARRQAGSTLKPFLYARALDRRLLTAASLLRDTPFEVDAGGGLFRPRNYDESFRGPVSVRTALAGSINVPAVRALLLVGPDDFAKQLRALGFAAITKPGDYYGPSLALGSAEVTLWQLVDAYRALANGGDRSELQLQPAVATAAARAALGAPAAFVVADILADRAARSVAFGPESPLATRFWSAVKTGTSKDMRDNWCVGFSRRYTVGVWVGNFSGEPMHEVSGVSGAAPIWADVMTWLHRDLPSADPEPPPGVVRTTAEFLDGVESARPEWFVAGTEPLGPGVAPAARARIAAPADGSILAVDPDISADRQRVLFAADSAAPGDRWVLDAADLGPAAKPLLWQPVAGRHRLQLLGAAAVEAVSFEVRGAPAGPVSCARASRLRPEKPAPGSESADRAGNCTGGSGR